MFEPEMETVTGGRRRLRNEELHDTCSETNIIVKVKVKQSHYRPV
jgi:hypothetical protein